MQQDEALGQYIDTFIQRLPRYAVKQKGNGSWKTKKKPLSDRPIKAHLNGQYHVAVLGKWYPGATILDLDDKSEEEVEKTREALDLDTKNSIWLPSESLNSYYILFPVSYNGKPPSLRLLNNILKPFAREHGIEIYPQPNKPIRLPFYKGQRPLDIEYRHLDSWQKMLFWFNKLDDKDLREVPNQQLFFDFDMPDSGNGYKIPTYEEGKFLYEHGLVEKHSRHDSQYKVLYYIWRHDVTPENAIEMTWQWIRDKHNNNSDEILTNPRSVKNDIIRQANYIYTKYELSGTYPDDIHNVYKGYITKPDIEKIIHISRAGLPKAKFLFNLIKYCYPRRHRGLINIHSNFLMEWSRRGYQKYLESLREHGIVKRYGSYQVNKFSKAITINWNFRDTSLAIITDRRAPETFEETIRASYKPDEFRELLINAGSEYKRAVVTTGRVFKR
jgi:hypothetical protein